MAYSKASSLAMPAVGEVDIGVDEAGRGSLLGPVVAAAVVLDPALPPHKWVRDSKTLTPLQRKQAAEWIRKNALAWAVSHRSAAEIDAANILACNMQAMHSAIQDVVGSSREGGLLSTSTARILIDGNYFRPAFPGVPHECVIKGDGKYACVAAASVLAKTHHDEMIAALVAADPSLQERYALLQNQGYGSPAHRAGIVIHGPSEHHRLSFKLV